MNLSSKAFYAPVWKQTRENSFRLGMCLKRNLQERDIIVNKKACITVNDRMQIKEQQIIQWQMNVETAEKRVPQLITRKKRMNLHLKGSEWCERT